MTQLVEYVWAVVWGWQGLALAVLGLNELSNWLLGRSWKWLHTYKWRVAVIFLVVTQAYLYLDRGKQPAAAPPAPGVGVIAENPDHAGLTDKLERQADALRSMEKERDDEKAKREAAEQRVRELEAKLSASAQRKASCDQLAALSASGRALVNKLLQTRAATETRREIDAWYRNVCDSLSRPQCEAFLAAPRKSDVWANYPFNDGGYSQTLRGRSEYLSAQLSTLCQ